MKTLALIVGALSLSLSACVTDTATTAGGSVVPAGSAIAEKSRAPLDFAFRAFDGALYAFDFAMDTKLIPAGSDKAKAVAAAGRKVLSFLNAAEAARDAGNAESYDQAFQYANQALQEFREALGKPRVTSTLELVPKRLEARTREQILDRAVA